VKTTGKLSSTLETKTSQQDSSSTGALSPAETATIPSTAHNGLSTGVKAGIGVGVALGVIFAFILGWLFARKFKIEVSQRKAQNRPTRIEGDVVNDKREFADHGDTAELDTTGITPSRIPPSELPGS